MKHRDLIIVGAGIVGLAHAFHAARSGQSVLVIERSARSSGASVRNFGMLAIVAQAQTNRQQALRSLETWRQIAPQAGFSVAQAGCLFVAKHKEELAVLEEFASLVDDLDSCTLIAPSHLGEYMPSANRSEKLLGGLWSADAWKVDQRQACARIARWLERERNVEFQYSTCVQDISLPMVETSRGAFAGNKIIVCSGNEFSVLYPEAFGKTGVTQCKLQMLRTRPQPVGWQLKPFLLGGLSLTRYAAFSACSSLPDLESMQKNRYAEYLNHGIHLIASQESDGSVTIGDSHHYGLELPDDRNDSIDQLMLTELSELIDLPVGEIDQKWCGHYAHLPGTDVLKFLPAENVLVVTLTNGQGMTHAFSVAEDVIAAFV